MILLNNFYTRTELNREEDKLYAVIEIDPAHDIFRGHFPGQPVVPGVCMIQIVKEFMEELTGQKLLFSKGYQVKFLQLLIPTAKEAIQVHLSWKAENGQYPVQADFRKNNEAVFKLSGLFLPA